jgi:predicted phosphate transport protein (TIGR00153 family)
LEAKHREGFFLFSKLFPKDGQFFELCNRAAENLRQGASELHTMLAAGKDLGERAKRIKQIEHDGDTLTHQLIQKLDQTFITPIDREDIHQLASALDDVLDLIEAVADRVVIFKIQKPTPAAQKLAQILEKSTGEITKAVAALEHQSEEIINTYCMEIDRLESEADRANRDAIAGLFENEKNPIEVIKWKEIYEFLEEATDCCEDVANILESVVLKHT